MSYTLHSFVSVDLYGTVLNHLKPEPAQPKPSLHKYSGPNITRLDFIGGKCTPSFFQQRYQGKQISDVSSPPLRSPPASMSRGNVYINELSIFDAWCLISRGEWWPNQNDTEWPIFVPKTLLIHLISIRSRCSVRRVARLIRIGWALIDLYAFSSPVLWVPTFVSNFKAPWVVLIILFRKPTIFKGAGERQISCGGAGSARWVVDYINLTFWHLYLFFFLSISWGGVLFRSLKFSWKFYLY